MPLPARQQRFCQEYVFDLNATQAAIRAGYSANTAGSIGHENLKKPEIQAEIARLQAERSTRVRLAADDVLLQLRCLVMSNITKLYNPDGTIKLPHEWDDDTAAAVAGFEMEEQTRPAAGPDGVAVRVVTVKVKLWDKPRAIALAMDHLGLSNKLTLETVFALLEPAVADGLRRAIAALVPGQPILTATE